MPQYTHHNFYSNFTASLKSGDLDLTNDILANEVSDFIVFDTDKIIKALNQADIKIDKNNTDEDIVNAVVKNINTNEKLKKSLAFIIAEGNEMLVAKDDKAKQLKKISAISDGLSKVGTEISKNPDSFKNSTMDQVVSKAEKRTEYKRTIWNKDKKGMSDVKVLLIGLGVLTLGIIILYYRQKRAVAQAIPNMIMGGNMTPNPTMPDPGTPTPVPTAEPIVASPPPVAPAVVQPIALLPEPVPAPTQQ